MPKYVISENLFHQIINAMSNAPFALGMQIVDAIKKGEIQEEPTVIRAEPEKQDPEVSK